MRHFLAVFEDHFHHQFRFCFRVIVRAFREHHQIVNDVEVGEGKDELALFLKFARHRARFA